MANDTLKAETVMVELRVGGSTLPQTSEFPRCSGILCRSTSWSGIFYLLLLLVFSVGKKVACGDGAGVERASALEQFWIDAKDRRTHSDWFNAFIIGAPPSADSVIGVGYRPEDCPAPDILLRHSLAAEYPLLSDWTWATNLEYRGNIYFRNHGLDYQDEAIAYKLRYQTSPWPPPSEGIAIVAVIGIPVFVFVDGMPFPEEVGPFRGRVAAFTENLTKATDGPFHWGFEVVTRRISPGQQIFSAGNEMPSLLLWDANADLIVADLESANYTLHRPKISAALDAGLTIVVNHATYTNLLSDLAVVAESQKVYWLNDPLPAPSPGLWDSNAPFGVAYCDVANGRLVDGSWGNATWAMGWHGTPLWRIRPVAPYRDLARVFNRLVRNRAEDPTPAVPELLLSTPDNRVIYWEQPEPLILRAHLRGIEQMAGVEFFDGASKIGEDWDWPFYLAVNDVAPGAHDFSARVLTEHGMITASNLHVIISSNLPALTMVQPTNSGVVSFWDPVVIEAAVSVPAGVFTNLQILLDGQLLCEAAAPPYDFIVAGNQLGGGSHSLLAKGFHNSGFTFTSAPVNIEVSGAVLHVSPTGSDAHQGSSWADAKRTVQSAADYIGHGRGEIWVQGGDYTESVNIVGSVRMLGGFAGNEADAADRAPLLHPTIIDCRGSNSAVAFLGSTATNCELADFIIRGASDPGSGILCSNAFVTISNCTISNNFGVAVRIDSGRATVADCLITGNGGGVISQYSSSTISNNQIIFNLGTGISCSQSSVPEICRNLIASNSSCGIAISLCSPRVAWNVVAHNSGGYGGGLAVFGGNGPDTQPVVANNVFLGNTASVHGGGIFMMWSQGHFVNNTIIGNRTSGQGGGVYAWTAYTRFQNNIVAFNEAGLGGGFYNRGSTTEPYYNCVYGNTPSDYDGLGPDPGSISVDPGFVDWANGDVHLSAESACINAGTNTPMNGDGSSSHPVVPFQYHRDLDGQGRVADTTVDIGADEFWGASENELPTLDPLADLDLQEDAGRIVVPLTGITGGMGGAGDGLFITARADRNGVIGNLDTTYISPQATGTLAFDVLANATGSVQVVVTVQDTGMGAPGWNSSKVDRSFTVNVQAVNDPPWIRRLPNRVAEWNELVESVPLLLGDLETPVDELSVSAISTNLDLLPEQGIAVIGNGDRRKILLTPAPNQAGESLITVSVSDGEFVAMEKFFLHVMPSNTPPLIVGMPPLVVEEGQTVVITNAVWDDMNSIDVTLFRSPEGVVSSNGNVYVWHTDESSGPSTNLLVTRVTDTLNCSSQFQTVPPKRAWGVTEVIVTEVNSAPRLPSIPNLELSFTAEIIITNSAIDQDIPANRLVYQLVSAPPDTTIDSQGIIHWRPTPDQLFLSQTFTTIVIEDAPLPLSDTNTFLIVLTNSIAPLILIQPSNQVVQAGSPTELAITALGEDPLSFQWRKEGKPILNRSGLSGAQSPVLAFLNASILDSGDYSIVVSNTHGVSTSTVATLSVIPPAPVIHSVEQVSNGLFSFTVSVVPGLPYLIESSTNLLNWEVILVTNATTMEFVYYEAASASRPYRFYRVAQPPFQLESDLVAYYPMDGHVQDSSGHGLNGAPFGATFSAGLSGLAADFDGTDDYITLPPTVTAGLKEGTFSAWLNIRSFPRDSAIIASQGGTVCANFVLGVSPDQRVAAHMCDGAGGIAYLSGEPIVPTNTWTMVTFTWDGTNWTFYVNGILETRSPISIYPADSEDTFKLGRHEHMSGPYFFDGLMDEIRVYSRALSATEIQRYYDTHRSFNNGLVAHYPFNGNVDDVSGGNHGTPVDVIAAVDRFGNSLGAYYFSGSSSYISASHAHAFDTLTNSLTLSAWIKIDSGISYDVYEYRHIISKGATYGDLTADFAMGLANPSLIPPAGSLQWENTQADNHFAHLSSGVIVPEASWHHVAITFESPTVHFYLDGLLINTAATPEPLIRASTQPLYIGCRYNDGGVKGAFQGCIDEVRIYNRALPASEIQQLYEWVQNPDNGHYYQVVAVLNPITWFEAQAQAAAAGAYLVTITSAKENAFIYSLAVANPAAWGPTNSLRYGPWLGGLQPPGSPEPDGGWEWVKNEGAFSYTSWNTASEPNDYGSAEDRLHFHALWAPPGTWNDIRSDGEGRIFGYIMERESSSPNQSPAGVIGYPTGSPTSRNTVSQQAQ